MLTPGERVGPYEVLSPLGAGGMGEVYRARDTRLGREVAIKVLPVALASDSERVRRFEQEARAASALNHPNIFVVYDIGTHDGSPYLVTELLEGESLQQLLEHGALPVGKAVEYGEQMAQGLAAAHEKGIVHRDLKPGNTFLTRGGIVKILDFGVAKLIHPQAGLGNAVTTLTAEPDTAAGVVLGTVGYMAPEQVRGAPCDHRADIFAYGCVLYEMLSGKQAFHRNSAADTMSAILHEDPLPLTDLNPRLPLALDEIVARCLEKRPEDRFQSVLDAGFALKTVTTTGPTRRPQQKRRSIALQVPIWAAGGVLLLLLAAGGIQVARRWLGERPLPAAKHLAVMRFVPEGNVPGLPAFADGLTGVVAGGLALVEQGKAGEFWVVPRSEAGKLGVETVQQVGQKFNVTVALTGRLRRSGDRLRLELAAIEPATGSTLRSTVIEDSISNVSSFQEEPVVRIAQILGLEVGTETRQRLTAGATTMPGAFEDYVQGCGRLAAPASGDDSGAAITLLERSVAQDPLYAAGRVALARACLARFEATKDAAWLDRGLENVDRSLRLGASGAGPWRAAAWLHRAAGRGDKALAALESGAQAAPNDTEVLLELADAYQAAGRFKEAEAKIRRAIYLRPGYWVGHNRLAKLYLAQGMNEAAVTEFRQVVDCAPGFALAYVKLGSVLCFLERTEDGRKLFERSVEIEPTYYGLSNLASLYFNASRFADAAAMFERALQVDDSDYSLWGNLAYAYRFGPKPEKAEATFRRAVALGEVRLRESPADLDLRIDLADYHAMLGEGARGLELIGPVVTAQPTDPQLVANLAETLWDLGDRDRAVTWVGRAFDAGVPRSRFEGRPTLRDLIADERYRALVGKPGDATASHRPKAEEGRSP